MVAVFSQQEKTMITIAGRILIRPEMRAQAMEAAVRVVRATQSDAGCLQYHFCVDLEDPNMLHVFEEWSSQEELVTHLRQPHTVEFLARIAEMAAGAPTVKRYVVSESRDLF
jgi:quinol monooxygenase YgiN